MKCPHCSIAIHESWATTAIMHRNQHTAWQIHLMRCPECKKEIIRLARIKANATEGSSDHDRFDLWLVYPESSNRGTLPPEVTAAAPDVAADHQEAALVLRHSAKASAALSRRCLQTVLREAGGYAQFDLAKQIDAALAEQNASKALPSNVRSTLDTIRHLGNFAAHKITDKTTLQLIDVEPHEAEFCLDALDVLFDHYYVRPAVAKKAKDDLNRKLVAAGKQPIP